MPILRYLKEEKDWEIIDRKNKKPGDLTLPMKLIKKLEFAKKQVRRDFDVGVLIDGGEGTGKSEFGGNVSRFMSDDKFDAKKHIIQDYIHAVDVITKVPDNSVVMLDEASLIFASTDVMKKEQKHMIKILQVCRQKNLCFVIISPSFFNLAKYIAVERTKILLHVYVGKHGERGFFSYYGEKLKRRLYQEGKKNFNSYISPKPSFRGRFSKCYLFDDDYKKIKRQTLTKALEGDAPKKKIRTEPQIKRSNDIDFVIRNSELKNSEIAKLLKRSSEWVRLVKTDLNKQPKLNWGQ